ncbi:hypothetical protein CSOJ01_06508 [Colletotrichum sojae]|uniref:Uncharacterized protein n=1 Tax=Colletotrichum sojae TaxID=2175907 RepID=A0A8H6JCI6_9PEZI|nr:hypothetical protein CSOJ01_06508 [Colletotrichum sojae]
MHFSSLFACAATVASFANVASAAVIDDNNLPDTPLHRTVNFQGAGRSKAGEQIEPRLEDAAAPIPVERRGDPTVKYNPETTRSFIVMKRTQAPEQKRKALPEDVLSTRPHLSAPSPLPINSRENCTRRGGRWRINHPWNSLPVERREAGVPAPEVVNEGQGTGRDLPVERLPSRGGRCAWPGRPPVLPPMADPVPVIKRDGEQAVPPTDAVDDEWVPRLPVVDLPKPVNHTELSQPIYLQEKAPSADGPRTPLKFHNHRGGN